jgi:hypothetical protein
MSEQYSLELDAPRLERQRDVIRAVMLQLGEPGPKSGTSCWLTLAEIAEMTGYPPASVSAQLRHLRNGTGGYGGPLCDVQKRRRGEPRDGLWEYRVSRKAEAA